MKIWKYSREILFKNKIKLKVLKNSTLINQSLKGKNYNFFKKGKNFEYETCRNEGNVERFKNSLKMKYCLKKIDNLKILKKKVSLKIKSNP